MQLEDLVATKVVDIASPTPLVMAPTDSISSAIAAMTQRRCGSTLVADASGLLLGIFTERDVMRCEFGRAEASEMPLADVMTSPPQVLGQEQDLSSALRLMIVRRVRHLPVVDGEGRVVGVLSVRAVLRYIAEAFPEEFLNLPPDPRHEARAPWGG